MFERWFYFRKLLKYVQFTSHARSQDFSWGGGGGGGAYLKDRDQIINVEMICHASSEDTRAQSPT